MSAREELLSLVERDGFITPESVLEAAQDPESSLHQHFTWDDSAAAERYRLVEAGRLIRRYKITVEVEPERHVKVRAFTSVPGPEDRPVYERTERALVEHRDVVFQQCMRDIAALRSKYQGLVDFDECLQASVGRKRRRKAS